ncbi:rod shape-determining protein MreD [Verrucomicrobiota bacterium]
MTWIVMVFVLLCAAVIQALLPGCAFLGHAKFPLLLMVVLYYALNREVYVMLIAGFMAGFIHDSFSLMPLGYSSACFCIIGFVAGCFRKLIMADSFIAPVFFGALAGVLATIGFYALLAMGSFIVSSAGLVVMKTIGTGILGMVCAPIVFYVIGRFDRLVGNVYVGESIDGVE